MGFPVDIQRYIPSKRFITNFQGIAANTANKQTAVVDITAAWNYLDIWLECANLVAANFQEIRLKIGGEVIQRWAGADLDAYNQYDKLPAFATYGVFSIPLRRRALRSGLDVINFDQKVFFSGQARELAYESSLNCGSAGGGFAAITDVTMELDLINVTTQPTIRVSARVTAPIPGGPGPVFRVDKQSINVGNGGITITKSQMGLDSLRPFLDRLLLVPAAGTLDSWQLRYGTNDWWVISDALRNHSALEDNLHTLQAGYSFLDFQEEGWGDSMLDLSQANADILLNVTGSGTAGVLVFYPMSLGIPFAPNKA